MKLGIECKKQNYNSRNTNSWKTSINKKIITGFLLLLTLPILTGPAKVLLLGLKVPEIQISKKEELNILMCQAIWIIITGLLILI